MARQKQQQTNNKTIMTKNPFSFFFLPSIDDRAERGKGQTRKGTNKRKFA